MKATKLWLLAVVSCAALSSAKASSHAALGRSNLPEKPGVAHDKSAHPPSIDKSPFDLVRHAGLVPLGGTSPISIYRRGVALSAIGGQPRQRIVMAIDGTTASRKH